MACNDCQKPQVQPASRSESPARGLGTVSVVYTGRPESAIWEGLRSALPPDSSIVLESDGTIRYTQRGLDGSEPPSPPEGFEVVDEWTFRSTWSACRGRTFIATVTPCGLDITAVCMEPAAEAFGAPVSCGWCCRCPQRKPIDVQGPVRRAVNLPPLPARHKSTQ